MTTQDIAQTIITSTYQNACDTAQIAADAWATYQSAQDNCESARQAYCNACETNADCATTINAFIAWERATNEARAAGAAAWQARDEANEAADEARNQAFWIGTQE